MAYPNLLLLRGAGSVQSRTIRRFVSSVKSII